MIPVGKILAAIRKNKDYQQNSLHLALKDVCSLGQLRDIEAGRTQYIKPQILTKWMEWLELNEIECQFLIQENLRCLVREELSTSNMLKVRPQLLGSLADLTVLIGQNKQIDIRQVSAEITKHILPHLLKRPPYIDAIMDRINEY